MRKLVRAIAANQSYVVYGNTGAFDTIFNQLWREKMNHPKPPAKPWGACKKRKHFSGRCKKGSRAAAFTPEGESFLDKIKGGLSNGLFK